MERTFDIIDNRKCGYNHVQSADTHYHVQECDATAAELFAAAWAIKENIPYHINFNQSN